MMLLDIHLKNYVPILKETENVKNTSAATMIIRDLIASNRADIVIFNQPVPFGRCITGCRLGLGSIQWHSQKLFKGGTKPFFSKIALKGGGKNLFSGKRPKI